MGLLSGKKWGGVEKENFTGPGLHEGSPRPAVCDLGAVENYTLANRCQQIDPHKAMKTKLLAHLGIWLLFTK